MTNRSLENALLELLCGPPRRTLLERMAGALKIKRGFSPLTGLPAWDKWHSLFPDLNWLWSRMRDDRSRQVLSHLVLHHLTGGDSHVLWRGQDLPWPPPVPTATQEETIATSFRGICLHRRAFHSVGFPATLYCPNGRPNEIFELQQYADPKHGLFVEPGNIVIDGGGCWGDSAIYFSHLAGSEGRVFTFEFLPENLEIMRRNFGLNPDLSSRIEILPHPIWSETGKEMAFLCDGPATRVSAGIQAGGQSMKFTSTTIDHLVRNGKMPRVDFIKLDIEGAELEALRGAERTIREFRPLMALCVYHCPDHFTQLARFVDSIHPDYHFSMDHFMNGPWETVLYASPR